MDLPLAIVPYLNKNGMKSDSEFCNSQSIQNIELRTLDQRYRSPYSRVFSVIIGFRQTPLLLKVKCSFCLFNRSFFQLLRVKKTERAYKKVIDAFYER